MNELWQRQNALMLTLLSADWLYDWLPACNNGYPLTKKLTSGVCLAYSGFRLLLTLFLIYMCWIPEPCRSVLLA